MFGRVNVTNQYYQPLCLVYFYLENKVQWIIMAEHLKFIRYWNKEKQMTLIKPFEEYV